jgi:hypothetical protein
VLLTTNAGIVSVSVFAVETWGVLKDRRAETFAGICEIGVVTDKPMPFTSWQVEHLPNPRTASEKSTRPRVASAEGGAFDCVEGMSSRSPSDGFAMPFNVAMYATTAVKSGRDKALAKDGIAVPAMPRAAVVAM